MNHLTQIRQRIDALLHTDRPVLVAIDGNCTAGKTTLADVLAREYDCNVFHMDDFFLRPEQRTPQRLAEPGGNVDYERFRQEVLLPLQAGEPVTYRPYDCHSRSLKAPVTVQPRQLNLIEGTYSRHPGFGDPYQLRIFLTVPPELQRQRVALRPEAVRQRFLDQWIPMEQQYFETFSIRDTSDLVLETISVSEPASP